MSTAAANLFKCSTCSEIAKVITRENVYSLIKGYKLDIMNGIKTRIILKKVKAVEQTENQNVWKYLAKKLKKQIKQPERVGNRKKWNLKSKPRSIYFHTKNV